MAYEPERGFGMSPRQAIGEKLGLLLISSIGPVGKYAGLLIFIGPTAPPASAPFSAILRKGETQRLEMTAIRATQKLGGLVTLKKQYLPRNFLCFSMMADSLTFRIAFRIRWDFLFPIAPLLVANTMIDAKNVLGEASYVAEGK
jgi:hypothetical protein